MAAGVKEPRSASGGRQEGRKDPDAPLPPPPPPPSREDGGRQAVEKADLRLACPAGDPAPRRLVESARPLYSIMASFIPLVVRLACLVYGVRHVSRGAVITCGGSLMHFLLPG